MKQNLKKYKNKLTGLLRTSKKMYFSNYLEISRHSSKETWKVLNILMKKQKLVINYPDSFNHDNNSETNDPKVIANVFAEYFTNIGSNLASK